MSDLFKEICAEAGRLRHMQRAEFIEYLADPDARIDYAFKRLRCCLELGRFLPTRAFRGAGQIVGTKHAASLNVLRHAYRTKNRSLLKRNMPDAIPSAAIGHVYFAIDRTLSGPIKIGFSTKLSVRLRGLNSKYGSCLFLATYIATPLDEHLLHCANAERRFEGEWFECPQNVFPGVFESLEDHREYRNEWLQRRAAA